MDITEQEITEFVALVDRVTGAETSPSARKTAEQQYHSLRSQPDKLMALLLRLILSGEERMKQTGCILIRRLFLKDAANQDVRLFDNCSNQVKEAVSKHLLKALQEETSSNIFHKISECLITLADEIVIPDDGDGRQEQNWPDLLRITLQLCVDDANVERKNNGLRMLIDLVPLYTNSLKDVQADIHKLLEGCFGHSEAKIRCVAVELVCKMVDEFASKEWKPLQRCLPVILRVVENLAQLRDNELLQSVLEAMIETAEREPIFYKPHVKEIAMLLSQIIGAREQLESDTRGMALGLFSTMAENKPKMCMSQFADFPAYLIKAAMDCMLEVSEDNESWAAVLDDEEDDEEDELCKRGGEVIDIAVNIFGIKKIGNSYFEAIGTYLKRSDEAWQYPHSALSAIAEGVEHVENPKHLDELMSTCLEYTTHHHMRVRAVSWFALGRIIDDHGPTVASKWHKEYMEKTIIGLNDPVERIQTKNLAAFLYFGEAVESVILELYADQLLKALVHKLNTSKHRGVIEESITSIAVIAGSIEKSFGPYYSDIMPMLKNFIVQSKDESETRLRGKAFECMSLFGVAVGKEKFREDCKDCLEALFTAGSQTIEDKKNAETLGDYLKDALTRVANVMKEEMGPYLPALLPRYLDTLHLEKHIIKSESSQNNQNIFGQNEDEDDDDENIFLEGGKKVKSQQFREMAEAAETLHQIVGSTKHAFLPHVDQCIQILVKIFETSDVSIRQALESDEVLTKCSYVWGAICGELAKSDQNKCRECLLKYAELNIKYLQTEEKDADTVSSTAEGLSFVLKSVAPIEDASLTEEEKAKFYVDPVNKKLPKYLDETTITSLFQLCQLKMDQACKRREEMLCVAGSYAEGAEDDEIQGEKNQLEDSDSDHDANVALASIIGALMLLNPEFFVQNLLKDLSIIIQLLLDPSKINTGPKRMLNKDKEVVFSKNKLLAYYLAGDCAEHLGSSSAPMWEIFLSSLFADLKNPDFEIRYAASVFVFTAASVPGFDKHASVALNNLVAVIDNPSEYGKAAQGRYVGSEELRQTEDNVVAAIFKLLASSPQDLSKNNSQVWDKILPKLPLKGDLDVSYKVVRNLLEIVLAQPQRDDVLTPERMGKVFAVLAESYKVTENEDLDRRIQDTFKKLPESLIKDTLQPVFSETQWKKLQKLMLEQYN